MDHSWLTSPVLLAFRSQLRLTLRAGLVIIPMHRAVFFCWVVSRGCVLQKWVYWTQCYEHITILLKVRYYYPLLSAGTSSYSLWGYECPMWQWIHSWRKVYITEAIFNIMCFWWYGSCREDLGILGEDSLIWDIARVRGSSVYDSSLVSVGLAYFEGRDDGKQPSEVA